MIPMHIFLFNKILQSSCSPFPCPRYANVIPVPETRVLLKGFKDSPEKQYINANYVKGPHNEAKYFIATQVGYWAYWSNALE